MCRLDSPVSTRIRAGGACSFGMESDVMPVMLRCVYTDDV